MNSVDSVVDGILTSSGQWVFPLTAAIIWLKYCRYSVNTIRSINQFSLAQLIKDEPSVLFRENRQQNSIVS